MSITDDTACSEDLFETEGAGGRAPVSEEDMRLLKAELQQIVSDASADIMGRRRMSEDVLFCRWGGQSDDGRKHEDAIGESPMPFEGASDMRIRLADRVLRVHRRLLLTALSRLGVSGIGSDDGELAAKMEALLKWTIDNRLSGVWRREWSKLIQWMLGDSPGAAVMGVYWERKVALVNVQITHGALVAFVARQNGGDMLAAMSAVEEIVYRAPEADGAKFIASFYPGIDMSHAKEALRAIRTGETATVPVPQPVENRPVVCAHRLFDDLFVPANTYDLQRARCIYRREWLTLVELEERQHTMGYSEEFIEAVEKHEGVTAFSMTERRRIFGGVQMTHGVPETRRGLYEVITAYYRAVNEYGVPAVYMVTFHGSVDFAAKDREILSYEHGRYPFVAFTRETLGDTLWDSRGIPELAMTDQYALKLLNDSLNDHTQLSTVPPVKVSANRPDFRLEFGPLSKIREQRPGEISFMSPPAYPQSNDQHRRDIARRVNEYFGVPADGVTPEDVNEERQVVVDDFLDGVREVFLQLLQLQQQYMSDDEVARVIGLNGAPIARSAEEIRGRFDLSVSFDARTLNLEWLDKVGKLIGNYVIGWDTEGVANRADLVRAFAGRIDPWIAQFVQPAEVAQKRELDDEDANLAKIMAGVEPPMMTEGQNFGARLNRLNENLQKNPEIIRKLTPVSQQILEARIKHLEGQVQQGRNAQIGRMMAAPVLGQ